MNEEIYYLILAALMLALIPIVPQMIRLRIAVLRVLHWNWLADVHEKDFGGWVAVVRIIMAAIALVMIVLVVVR
jgi:hypothetical protein